MVLNQVALFISSDKRFTVPAVRIDTKGTLFPFRSCVNVLQKQTKSLVLSGSCELICDVYWNFRRAQSVVSI